MSKANSKSIKPLTIGDVDMLRDEGIVLKLKHSDFPWVWKFEYDPETKQLTVYTPKGESLTDSKKGQQYITDAAILRGLLYAREDVRDHEIPLNRMLHSAAVRSGRWTYIDYALSEYAIEVLKR